MADFLTTILNHKNREVVEKKRRMPEEQLREAALKQIKQTARRGFFKALETPGPFGVNIIAEIKRASPSKGPLCMNLDPARMAGIYEETGAAAMSVLTETGYFKAKETDLQTARDAVRLPVLRKDFLIDPYQIYESAVMGADAILIIVAAVSPAFLQEALSLAAELHLDVLVEVHDADELQNALDAGAKLIGINNRNLKTFVTDLSTTEVLSARLPSGVVAVGESGIKNREDILRLKNCGVFNFLIGESLVTAKDKNPARELGALLGKA